MSLIKKSLKFIDSKLGWIVLIAGISSVFLFIKSQEKNTTTQIFSILVVVLSIYFFTISEKRFLLEIKKRIDRLLSIINNSSFFRRINFWIIQIKDFIQKIKIFIEEYRNIIIPVSGLIFICLIYLLSFSYYQKKHPVEDIYNNISLSLKFEEGRENIIHDSSPQKYNGTIYGEPRWVVGKRNLAVELNGKDNYIEIKNTNNQFEKGDYTFSLWTKSLGERNKTKYILCHCNWSLKWLSDSEIAFNVGRMNTSKGPFYLLKKDIPQKKNDWIFLAGVYNPSDNKISFYVDGEKVDEKNIGSDRIFEEYGKEDLMIGYSCHGNSTYYKGIIDEAIIYNKSLNDNEIKMIYYKGKYPFLYSPIFKIISSISLIILITIFSYFEFLIKRKNAKH